MPYTVTAAPAIEPVTTSELKAYLRYSRSTEDSLIGTLITAARQQLEGLTRRPLVTQTLAASFPDWPDGGFFALPFGNALTLSSLKYRDETNAEITVTLSGNVYLVSAVQPGRVYFVDGYSFPSLYNREDAVIVTATAGYGATTASVPEALRLAVMQLAAYWFEQRLPVNVGNLVSPMPLHVHTIVNRYRVIVTEP